MSIENTPALPMKPPPPPASAPGRDRRPFGLLAIIALLILNVIASVLAIVSYWYLNPQWMKVAMSSLDNAEWFLYIALVEPILIVARIVTIVGLWRRRPWAWFLTMALLTYAMATNIFFYFQGEFTYPTMLLNVVTVFYLNLREVQELFMAQPAGGKS